MTIGKKIKEIRIKRGYTQKELGALCGMADSAIRRYESDRSRPKFENLSKIADALGVSALDLIEKNEFDQVVFDTSDNRVFTLQISGQAQEAQNMAKVVKSFNKLNNIGQEKAIEQIELLTKIPEYKNDNSPK